MFAHDHKQRSGERDLNPSYQFAIGAAGRRAQTVPSGTAPPSSAPRPPSSDNAGLRPASCSEAAAALAGSLPVGLPAGGAPRLWPV